MLIDPPLKRSMNPITPVSRAMSQAKNYATVVWWLLHRAFRGRSRTLIAVLACSALNILGQGAGIYSIYWYARKMASDGIVSSPALGLEFAARSEVGLLLTLAVFAVCLVGGATFLFLSRRLILNLVKARFVIDLEQLIYTTAALPDPRALTASRLFIMNDFGGLLMGCRFGSITTISFSNAISSLRGAAAAALALFWMNAPLTLLILFCSAVSALSLYPITLRAVRFAKQREKTQATYRKEFPRVHNSNSPSAPIPGEMASTSGLANNQFGSMQISLELSFAIQVGVTVILAVVTYYLATEMMAGRQNWAILIAYIGSLRIMLMGCSQVVRAYANVSRFYLQIIRYFLFVKDAQRIASLPLGSAAKGEPVILGRLADGTEIISQIGERLALATFDSIRMVRFALLHARVFKSRNILGSAWLDLADFKFDQTATIILVDANLLADCSENERLARETLLNDKVTLVIHRSVKKIGTVGETRLLVEWDGEFQRLATVGTPQSESALEEFSIRIAQRGRENIADPDEPENEDDDLL